MFTRGERKLIFFKYYFIYFYKNQSTRTQEKIEYVFDLIRKVERVPEKFFKHLSGTDGLYEIRIEVDGNVFRVFCCFDKGNLVGLLNGFQKKTQKTSKKDIELALTLMKEYFKERETYYGK